MALSRRAFVGAVGFGGAGIFSSTFVSARGREAFAGLESTAVDAALQEREAKRSLITIHANENPYGPSPSALTAARNMVSPIDGRYPGNVKDLTAAIASRLGVKPENVMLGTGSGELVRAAVLAFTSPSRALVQGIPTWENPAAIAAKMKAPVKSVRVDSALKLDLDGMAAAANGAGMVFFCNPNNPTSTIHPAKTVAAFVERVLAASPSTTILIDEAYHDFVVDPAHATAVPLAMEHKQVIVTRTFSKAHGMAGLRVGYAIAHPDTLKAIADYKSGSVNVLSAAAARASIQDTAHIAKMRDQIRASLEATVQTFKDAGCQASDSQGNFVFVDVKRPAKVFRDACERMGVIIGRDFPPLTNWARITIGTVDEMKVANEVFKKALAEKPQTTASR